MINKDHNDFSYLNKKNFIELYKKEDVFKQKFSFSFSKELYERIFFRNIVKNNNQPFFLNRDYKTNNYIIDTIKDLYSNLLHDLSVKEIFNFKKNNIIYILKILNNNTNFNQINIENAQNYLNSQDQFVTFLIHFSVLEKMKRICEIFNIDKYSFLNVVFIYVINKYNI